MAKKKSFVLRIDPETYDALEKWASDEFRSTNAQIEYILHHALRKAGRAPVNKGNKSVTDNQTSDEQE
jgi:hypothetical protein